MAFYNSYDYLSETWPVSSATCSTLGRGFFFKTNVLSEHEISQHQKTNRLGKLSSKNSTCPD